MAIIKNAKNINIVVKDTYTSISKVSYEESEEVIVEALKENLELSSQKKVVKQGFGKESEKEDLQDEKNTEDKVCICKKSSKATNFKTLIELVKQAEDILIQNGYNDMGDRISIIRGIYYGTEWSLDYSNEKSSMRNKAFNIPYTGSTVKADARKVLKCCDTCKADLFNSLFNSYEVFDSTYTAVDFGHLIIGLDSRRSYRAKSVSIPTQGGTGLEIVTWLGDLGGGTGMLCKKRASSPTTRAKSAVFQTLGHSYGCMVNLEGDIAAFVVGMDTNNPSKITYATDYFDTIHEALADYFYKKWNKRTFYFLAMYGSKLTGNTLTYNRDNIINDFKDKIEGFADWYIATRMVDKDSGGAETFAKASSHFEPASEEVAEIFFDALLHIVPNPQDMITARTDPAPKPSKKSNYEKVYEKATQKIKEFEDWINQF